MARQLPPLNALRAFEAAGRHQSFSLAADELHVTQGAVSRQVRLFEEFLGELVFHRGPRGVVLTESGKRYLEITSEALDRIESVFSARPSKRRHLSVSVLPSSATLWLQERLGSFELQNPGLRLIVSTSQRPVNFDQDGVDLAMRVGILPNALSSDNNAQVDLDMVSNWNGVEAICLWEEEVAPICSRSYLESIGGLSGVDDLNRATMIHNETRPRQWAQWLKAHGGDKNVKGAKELHLGQRYMVIHAAREGHGVACVPTIDIDMLSWRDEIVYPFEGTVQTGNAYYLLYRRDSVRRREIQFLCDWIQALINPAAQASLSG